MTFAGLVIDTLLIGVSLLIVFISCRRGAVKMIMSLLSDIAALLLAYAFTPMLSAYLKTNFFLDKFAKGIMSTVASLSESGKDAAQNIVYDVSELMENSQFLSLLEKYRADPKTTGDFISNITESGKGAVEKVSYSVAQPISSTVSNICAFVIIFVVSLILLRLLTFAVSAVFKLPVLKDIDKTTGLVLGVVSAVFFILVFAMVTNRVSDVMTSTFPATFPENFAEGSIILRFLSKYNILGLINNKLGI